jgi:hypothetical protein
LANGSQSETNGEATPIETNGYAQMNGHQEVTINEDAAATSAESSLALCRASQLPTDSTTRLTKNGRHYFQATGRVSIGVKGEV